MENYSMILLGCMGFLCLVLSAIAIVVLRSGKTGLAESGEKRSVTDGYGVPEVDEDMGRSHVLAEPSVMTDEYSDIVERFCVYMNTEKPYRQPEIRISDVASKLNVTKNTLSRAIRMKTGKNFCQLVHSYRVKEAMRLYAANTSLSITQLCRMVGFNSATTFNTAFGRNTGLTPAEWCKNYRKQHLDVTYEVNKRK